ncbi:MAG: hypothetical protein M3R02_11105 [Chloroflexota bacterium]|nr:hypothetical protein [Chloroflexota bacterium]
MFGTASSGGRAAGEQATGAIQAGAARGREDGGVFEGVVAGTRAIRDAEAG